MGKIGTALRNHWDEIKRVKTSDHEIALGFAVGTGLVILPTPGVSIVVGFLVALVYKRISKISMAISFLFWNPITMIPVYSLAYLIGSAVFANAPVHTFDFVFLDKIYLYTRRFLVGLITLSVILSFASYGIIRGFLYYRAQKRNEIKRKKKTL